MPKNYNIIKREQAYAFQKLGIPYTGFIEGIGYQYNKCITLGSPYFRDGGWALPHFVPVLDASPKMRLQSVNFKHKVTAGDSLSSIAKHYGISENDLKSTNPSIDWEQFDCGSSNKNKVEEIQLPEKSTEPHTPLSEIPLHGPISLPITTIYGQRNRHQTKVKNRNADKSTSKRNKAFAQRVRNSWFNVIPGHGIGPAGLFNPYYKAEAIFGDIGISFIGPEADLGGVLILAGNEAGTFHTYKEFAGGAATEIGISIERGRIDYTGEHRRFSSDMIYGIRSKIWIGAGAIIGANASGSWARTDDNNFVISTAVAAGASLSPFAISLGYNKGTIKK